MIDKDKYLRWETARQEYLRENYNASEIAFLHKTKLGATASSILLGLNKYKSALDLYNDMMTDEVVENTNFAMYRGQLAEQQLERFSPIGKLDRGMILIDSDRAWSMCQIDFFNQDGIPVECKTASSNYVTDDGLKNWGKGSLLDESGKVVKEDSLIPLEYEYQCQKQMYLYGKATGRYIDKMYLCAWLMFENFFRTYVVHYDQSIVDEITKAEDNFIFEHLLKGVPPESDDTAIESTVIDVSSSVFASQADIDAKDEYQRIKAEIAKLQDKQKLIEKKLRKAIGDNATLIDSDGNAIAKQQVYTTNRFNTSLFKKEQTELYAKYLSESKTRRFTIGG
jgi:predicted phage-related endonuclease